MSMSNNELVRRADLALSDLSGTGGILQPEQSNRFIDMVQEQPTILNQARLIRMNSPQMNVNRLGFGSRIMKAAVQAGGFNDGGGLVAGGVNDRYLQEADRSKPTTAQISLNTKELMAEIHIPYEVLEDNIEGNGGNGAGASTFEAHIMRLIAERAAQDLEEWALDGDTLSGDAYLATNDGLLKQATSNVVDNLSAGISPDLFESGMLAMPQKYLRNLSALRHWVTVQDDIRYRANVAKRATGYGDSSLTETGRLVAYGIPVEPAPLMAASTGLFTFPQNILFGVQRNIMIETDKDIRSRQIIIVLTIRADVLFDDEPAVVKYTNI